MQNSADQIEEQFVGSWRRFGVAGPVYETVAQARTNTRCEGVIPIRVLETGEELDYKVSAILHDPQEHR